MTACGDELAEDGPREPPWESFRWHWRRRRLTVFLRACRLLTWVGPSLFRLARLPTKKGIDGTDPAAAVNKQLKEIGTVVDAGSLLLQECRKMKMNTQDVVANRPPVADFDAARRVILKELGRDPADIFEIPPGRETPVSISDTAQVFRWVFGGREVAVKIQRQGIRETLALDMFLLRRMSGVVADMAPNCICDASLAKNISARSTVETMARAAWLELDFPQMALNQARFSSEILKRVPGVRVPEVCWPVTSGSIVTSTWVSGLRITELFPTTEPKQGETCLGKLVANGLVTVAVDLPAGALLSKALQVAACPPFSPSVSDTGDSCDSSSECTECARETVVDHHASCAALTKTS